MLSNDVNQILQRPTLVAMATKIEAKQKKTYSARIENIAVPLALSRWYSFVGGLLNDVSQILPRPAPLQI